jgi:hypothetical protein
MFIIVICEYEQISKLQDLSFTLRNIFIARLSFEVKDRIVKVNKQTKTNMEYRKESLLPWSQLHIRESEGVTGMACQV